MRETSVKKAGESRMSAEKPALVLRLRLKVNDLVLLGPGKADLLDAIDRTGSISAAARAMGMSYRRAWLLLDEVSRHLDQPVVDASFGGKGGGGARLTAFGRSVRDCYRRMQARTEQLLADDIAWLAGHTVVNEEPPSVAQ
jgi:molybdate transport system regulatory protein